MLLLFKLRTDLNMWKKQTTKMRLWVNFQWKLQIHIDCYKGIKIKDQENSK
jgi:hypothetical protein